jgi:hypothetical protein
MDWPIFKGGNIMLNRWLVTCLSVVIIYCIPTLSQARELNSNNKTDYSVRISNKEINTIIFPVKIIKVLQPSYQHWEIVYLNENKAMSFQSPGKPNSNGQFIVSLNNGQIISLQLKLCIISGTVTTISTSIAGTPLEVTNLGYDNSNYHQHIINVMKNFIDNPFPGEGWVETLNRKSVTLLDKNFKVSQQVTWNHDNERLDTYTVCSTSRLPIALDEHTWLNNKKIIAVTVVPHVLLPKKCGEAFILSADSINEVDFLKESGLHV